ncbi:HAD-like protein [Pleomassaria siparia CBS 279.74]|uniref:Mitochondrial import inner membrane translocase subunit TIM50 n=1 Tax=Pleomassaria siparia CBS 279.74 TaxID=1314801 RepID=A0A6G1KEP6_9PLEO|nr:HAD-like protein [Pleomassaria siparia CBS 279.74]
MKYPDSNSEEADPQSNAYPSSSTPPVASHAVGESSRQQQQLPQWNVNNPYVPQYPQYPQYGQHHAQGYVDYVQQQHQYWAAYRHYYGGNMYQQQYGGNAYQQQYVGNAYQQQNSPLAPFTPNMVDRFESVGQDGSYPPTTPQVYEHPQYLPGEPIPTQVQAPTTLPLHPKKGSRNESKEEKQKKAVGPPADNPASVKSHKDKKIMLPGPTPTASYLAQAAEEPFVIDPPDRVLVILDLNGTLIFRPNPRQNATRMIARPFLKQFLRYLFSNFSVMIWSSAKPENVKVLVDNVLDDDLRAMLVACLARDSFNLLPQHYGKNVQVYKDLNIIWNNMQIQSQIPDHEYGKQFGQHNTVLIDDTIIKASAQPHNLLLIPEFAGTAADMKGDILREVAGYLEVLKMQWDVSKFMRKQPFEANGRWQYDWEDDLAEGGDLKQKISLTD